MAAPVCLLSLSSHVPNEEMYTKDFQEIVREAAESAINKLNPEIQEENDRIAEIRKNSEWVCRLSETAGIKKRHAVIDGIKKWYRERDFEPTYTERAELWRRHCPKIAMAAVDKCLVTWGGDKDRITHVVTHSTTGWDVPGLSHHIMYNLELPTSARAVPVNFVGCQGGLSILFTSCAISSYDPNAVVLACASEIQSPHGRFYRKGVSLERSIYMPNILFGDASGAAIVGRPTPEDGKNFPIWEFGGHGAHYIPNTRHVLVIQVSEESGEYVENSIKKELPIHLNAAMMKNLGKWIGRACGKEIAISDLEFAVHPGGMKLLQNFCKLLGDMGHPKANHAARFSFKNLINYGNLASAAILFILNDICNAAVKDNLYVMAMGPGVCLEYFGLKRYNPREQESSNTQRGTSTNPLYLAIAVIVGLIAFIFAGFTRDDLWNLL